MPKLLHCVAAFALMVGGCAAVPSSGRPQGSNTGTTDPDDFTVQLFRGVRVVAGTTNQIDWSGASFGVSGAPPTLSLFDSMAPVDRFPCWVSFQVDYPGVPPPVVNGVATVDVPAPGNWNPGPWNVVFDNNPPGHWSISRVTIGGTSNNQASGMAAGAIHGKVLAGTATIHDGSAVGCH